jgi:hypothetical protein
MCVPSFKSRKDKNPSASNIDDSENQMNKNTKVSLNRHVESKIDTDSSNDEDDEEEDDNDGNDDIENGDNEETSKLDGQKTNEMNNTKKLTLGSESKNSTMWAGTEDGWYQFCTQVSDFEGLFENLFFKPKAPCFPVQRCIIANNIAQNQDSKTIQIKCSSNSVSTFTPRMRYLCTRSLINT